MRVLLDTHTLLWYYGKNPRLPERVRELLDSDSVNAFASHVSVWEVAIKAPLGKLSIEPRLDRLVEEVDASIIEWLPIGLNHLLRIAELPLHHRDPFDRLLAAQCLVEKVTLLSADPAFDNYGVDRRW